MPSFGFGLEEENQRLRARVAELEGILAGRDLRDAPTSSGLEIAALLETLLSQAPLGIAFLDTELRFQIVNERFAGMTGLPREQHLGRTVDDVMPFRAAELGGLLHEVVDTGRPLVDHEFSSDSTGSELRWFWESWYPVRAADGKLLGLASLIREITARKEHERVLEFQNHLIESTSDAFVAIDAEHRVTYWNAGAERLYGVPRAEAVGRPVKDLRRHVWLEPGDEQRALDSLKQNGSWSGDIIHVRRDGTPITVSSNINVIRPEQGGGMFAAIRDITERKKAEAVLREREATERNRAAELDAIMAAAPAVVSIAYDPECRSIIGNRMAYELLGVPPASNFSKSAPEDEKPKSWREIKDGKDLAPEELPMQIAARTGRRVRDFEFDLAFEDGTSQVWLGNAEPLFDDAGHSRGAVGVFVDISERKRSEERLRHTQKLESIGLLAGGIAHDFNNLLVGVVGNASLAIDMLPPGHDAADLLGAVIRIGEQLAHLTRQMLAFAGKGRFVVERVNLSDLIPQMTTLIQPSIPKRIALHFQLAPGLPGIDADPSQMQQVFMNLVLNAAEAIANEVGVISVRTRVEQVDESFIRRHPSVGELAPGKYVCLEVQDTGCGMDAATQAKVFDPFFTTKFTGRGLGLAAVGGIVRSHKGGIVVASAPGQGSTFRVWFPVAQSDVAETEASGAPVPAQVTGTVLVVDDEEVVRNMASHALTRHGFDVLLASSGAEAIDIARRHPGEIAVIMLDVNMPGMSGEEVVPLIRKLRPASRILVSSGYNEVETMALFQDEGIAAFIQKPYTAGKLAEKIRSVLA